MNASQQGRADEHPLFGGMASAHELEQLERTGAQGTRTQMAGFEGSLRGGPGDAVDLRLADPKAEVVAFVRPGRGLSAGIPEGTRVKVTQATFLANRGTLCTAEELARIKHSQGGAQSQAVDRDLQSMRRSYIQASRLQMDPAKLAAEREKAEHELGEVQERQAADMARAHAEMVKPPAPRPVPQSPEELKQRIDDLQAQRDRLGASFGTKGRAELDRVFQAELEELAQAFQAAQLARQVEEARAEEIQERRGVAPAAQKTPRERLVELKAMLTDGLITDELYEKQRAAIVEGV